MTYQTMCDVPTDVILRRIDVLNNIQKKHATIVASVAKSQRAITAAVR